jgi:hypothetical protein
MQISTENLVYSERLLIFLKTSFYKNRITPSHPILARRIVEIAEKSGIKITVEDIYHCTHYLREKNEPIMSSQRGYSYTDNPDDFNSCIAEQIKIISERQETLTLLKRIQANLFKATHSVFENQKAEILKQELDLIPINQTENQLGGKANDRNNPQS